jgi:hypothetical protein
VEVILAFGLGPVRRCGRRCRARHVSQPLQQAVALYGMEL